MKTMENKKYAMVHKLACGHYPMIVKASKECVTCLAIAKEKVTPIQSTKDIVYLEEGGGLISAYCTQDLLSAILIDMYGDIRVKLEEPLGDDRMRADIMIDGDTVIEFDGYHHYTNARVICSDIKKDRLCTSLGIKIIRVPFWVQLNRKVAELLGITDKFHYINAFPHGWNAIAVFPASFCSAGVERFYSEFSRLTYDIQDEIFKNLLECENQRCQEEVWTTEQKNKLESILMNSREYLQK